MSKYRAIYRRFDALRRPILRVYARSRGRTSGKCPFVAKAQFLKIRNCELRFLLPVCEVRNWESENDSFSIPFTISLIPIPVPITSKCGKKKWAILLNLVNMPAFNRRLFSTSCFSLPSFLSTIRCHSSVTHSSPSFSSLPCSAPSLFVTFTRQQSFSPPHQQCGGGTQGISNSS